MVDAHPAPRDGPRHRHGLRAAAPQVVARSVRQGVAPVSIALLAAPGQPPLRAAPRPLVRAEPPDRGFRRDLRRLADPPLGLAAPLLVNVLVFGALLYLLWAQLGPIRTYVEGWLPDWLDFLAWALLPVLVLLSLLVLFFGFSTVGNLIAAPFNSLLSEAVERRLDARPGVPGAGALSLAEVAVRMRGRCRGRYAPTDPASSSMKMASCRLVRISLIVSP